MKTPHANMDEYFAFWQIIPSPEQQAIYRSAWNRAIDHCITTIQKTIKDGGNGPDAHESLLQQKFK